MSKEKPCTASNSIITPNPPFHQRLQADKSLKSRTFEPDAVAEYYPIATRHEQAEK